MAITCAVIHGSLSAIAARVQTEINNDTVFTVTTLNPSGDNVSVMVCHGS